MNKLFTQNLPWKIAALVVAILLWIFVINTQNPTQPQEISSIPVKILGYEKLVEQGYELTNKEEIQNQNFKVVVSGPRLEIDKLVRDPSLIKVTLDLEGYLENLTDYSTSEEAHYSIKINLDGSSVTIKDRRPQVTKVRIDKVASKEQKVSYVISEELLNKYTLLGDGKPIISPEKITITGAKTDIDRVAEARVSIKSENFSEDQLVSELPVTLYDVDGEEIQGLELSDQTIEVKLPIGSQKRVPINITYTGKVPDEYVLTKVEASAEEVTIVGKAEVIDSISQIDLEPINLDLLTESDANLLKVKMKLPNGVMTVDGDEVSVSLQVRKKKTLNYPILMSELQLDVQGIGEGLTYEILTTSINVEVSGLSDDLIMTDKSDIKATLDLKGYKEGEYTLPLNIVTPENIQIANNPINVEISIKALDEDVSDEVVKDEEKPEENEKKDETVNDSSDQNQ